jgi:hypothetical protein
LPTAASMRPSPCSCCRTSAIRCGRCGRWRALRARAAS